MPAALRCPGCGNVLQADAPEGLCPGCLFVQAMQGGPGYDVGPSTTAPQPPGDPFAPQSPGDPFAPQSPGDPFAPQSPGDPFAPPRPEDLAPHFPQLEILEFLGQGGMGVVYKARQVRLDRFVALKVLPPERGRDPAFAERFAREARALARLSHPRIVGVHDFGEVDGLFYLLMEFVDGANLRHRLRRGRLAPDEALRIVPQVCEALQYAHEEGVVHRDIKPENILLDRRGNVKIADFGLAKLLGMLSADSVLTGSRQVIGTLRYMAPEQMDTPLAVDHRADIYSLGVVFYEMLTGELPVGRFDPPSKRAGVDSRLDEVVLRALDREPDRRYQNASDVKADVESLSLLPVHSGTASGISPDEVGGPPATKRQDAWLLLPILCAAIIAGLSRFIDSPPDPGGALGPLVLVRFTLTLAAGLGLWGIWRFARSGRTEKSIRPNRGARPSDGRIRPAWPWLVAAGLALAAHYLSNMAPLPAVATSTRHVSNRAPETHLTFVSRGVLLVVAGLGAWGLWRYFRRGKVEENTRPKRAEGPRITALEEWRPSPWLILVVGLYVACLFEETAYSDGSNLYRLSGYRHMFGAAGILPNWLTTFSLLFGSWALLTRRELTAGMAGLIGTGSVLYAARAARIPSVFDLPGYQLCAASMVLLAVGGFHGWWRNRRESGARYIKMTFATIDSPGSDSGRSSGPPRARSALGRDGAGGHRAARRRDAWLLVPLLCAMVVTGVYLGDPGSVLQAWIAILAVWLGLWASWRFVRGEATGDTQADGPETAPHGPAPTRDIEDR